MASVSKYLSVLKKADTAGSIIITVVSKGTFAPTTVSATVALLTSDSEEAIALKLTDGINTAAASATPSVAYIGVPNFEVNGLPYPLLIRALQIGHIVNVWSQIDISVTVNAGTTGVVVKQSDIPVYPLFSDVRSPVFSKFLAGLDVDLDCLNPSDLAEILLLASAEIIGYADYGPFIKSTYLHEQRGHFQSGYNVENYPVLEWDWPVIFGGVFPNPVGANLFALNMVMTMDRDGCAEFNAAVITAAAPGWFDPLNRGTILKQTYIAGLPHVHPLLKSLALREIQFLSGRNEMIESITTAAGSVKIRKPQDHEERVRARLVRLLESA